MPPVARDVVPSFAALVPARELPPPHPPWPAFLASSADFRGGRPSVRASAPPTREGERERGGASSTWGIVCLALTRASLSPSFSLAGRPHAITGGDESIGSPWYAEVGRGSSLDLHLVAWVQLPPSPTVEGRSSCCVPWPCYCTSLCGDMTGMRRNLLCACRIECQACAVRDATRTQESKLTERTRGFRALLNPVYTDWPNYVEIRRKN